MRLGGVDIPHDRHAVGHSDADVLLHAVTDALLGAAALGDIGGHFPASDAHNAGRPSRDFATEAAGMVRGAGYRICNVDATVIAERPKLAAQITAMRVSIAEMLGVSVDEVSVKASTNNGIGSLGAGEGVAAHAVFLIESDR